MDSTSTFPTSPQGSSTSNNMPSTDDMVDRAGQGVYQGIDNPAERAKPPLHRVQQGIYESNRMMHRKAEQVSEIADEWTTSLQGTVRQHPLTAVVTAMVCGLLMLPCHPIDRHGPSA